MQVFPRHHNNVQVILDKNNSRQFITDNNMQVFKIYFTIMERSYWSITIAGRLPQIITITCKSSQTPTISAKIDQFKHWQAGQHCNVNCKPKTILFERPNYKGVELASVCSSCASGDIRWSGCRLAGLAAGYSWSGCRLASLAAG